MTRRRRCTLLVALSLATLAGGASPSAPAAVSPGDSQYQDPILANQTAGSTNSSTGGKASQVPGNAAPLASAPPAQSDGSTSVARKSSQHSSSSGRQLAATGAEVGLVALAGAGMLLAGIGLRLREPGA